MRRIVVFCIVATVLAAMTSCGTAKKLEQLPTQEEELTQRWAGKEYSDIVQSFGAPDRIAPDGKDGSIIIYENVSTTYETDKSLVFDDYTTTVKNEKKFIHFFLNPEGSCYLVKTNRHFSDTARGQLEEKASTRFWLTTLGTMAAIGITVPIIMNIRHERWWNEHKLF